MITEGQWFGARRAHARCEAKGGYLGRRLSLSAVFLWALLWICPTVDAQSLVADLPDGEGRELVVRMCVDCHGLDRVVGQRETQAVWETIVIDMIGRGARGTSEEQRVVAAYLAEHFGRDAAEGTGMNAAVLDSRVYEARCGSCHGEEMTGGDGPGIVAYVRYHTDREVAGLIRDGRPGMPPMELSDDELRQILATIRVLAGTNPAMATGGFTGSRGDAPPVASRAQSADGGGGVTTPLGPPTTVELEEGRTLSGIMMAQSDFDATLLGDRRFHLLARDGAVFREKPIEPKSDWLQYDGGVDGNRYSTLDQINRENLSRLAPAWVFPMPNSMRLEATPVVVDGIMYVTGWNEIFALDATTGHQLWTYHEPHTPGLLGEAGAGANRGATLSGDRVFMTSDRAHVLAFDRFTGEKLWEVEMGSIEDGYSTTSPPLIVGDLVVAGVAGGEEGARGFLDAYRASDGERVWRFYTIPARGEPGSETWVGQALEHGCGPTWLTGSYDPELDLIYWAIGNPCPDMNGEERMGDNLFTNSVVALASRTGEMKWYYQFTPHDTHDWDAVQPMVLADEMWQGQPRKLIIHGDRNGFLYVLDRTNGEVLLHEPFVGKQTWNLGFTPDGRPIIDPASISTRAGSAVCPGSGANWPAVSYNPGTKLFYLRASDGCTIVTAHEDPLGASGNRWFGRGAPTPEAQQRLAALLEGYQTGNFIRAMDPFTGRKVWDYPAPPGRGGAMSTASGLVFIGGGGGLMALDAITGEPLWRANLGQTTQSTPMTYMVGGKQFVALPGNGLVAAYSLKN
jgi:alcohol dehydrogenase (cytochrome c)